MHKGDDSGSRQGFTLIEVVISLTILTILAVGITNNLLQTRKIAESNIRESTATAIVSGYLEQLKSLEYERLLESVADPSIPLPTRISYGELDPLYIDEWNEKDVVIDMDINNNEVLTMKLYVRPILTDVSSISPGKAVNIVFYYAWEQAITGNRVERTIRTQRSYVPTF